MPSTLRCVASPLPHDNPLQIWPNPFYRTSAGGIPIVADGTKKREYITTTKRQTTILDRNYPASRSRAPVPERRLNQAARPRTLQRARRVRRELFLFAKEGGNGFLFLLEDASDIGGDIRILGRPKDTQGHASHVF